MPRPCKRRRVCAMPGCQRFGPLNRADAGTPNIVMRVDEFESIRLIDLFGMTQEECAAQMDVARTTAQAIYNSARAKIAECIVGGKTLTIEGGQYRLCEERQTGCGCGRHCRRCGEEILCGGAEEKATRKQQEETKK